MIPPTDNGRSAGRGDLSQPAPFWVSRKAARRALVALHVAAAGAVVIELLRPFGDAHGAATHAVERIAALDFPASYALFGFVACVALVLVGRLLRLLVMRGERYYSEDA